MAKPIIVTGAAGFIGRNVVAELNARGEEELILVDELGKDEKWKNLRGLHYEDIVAPEDFLGLLEDGAYADARSLIHLGACSATTEKDADYLLRNNYQYTRVLCNWSLSNEVRFVYASSAATYGAGELGYDDADTVTPNLKPLNMYGYSKHMFDLWALKHDLFDHIVGLKYYNVFGPYEDHKGDMRSVVNKSFEQIRTDGFVRLFKSYKPEYKDGEQKRDFIYVKDAVDVTLHFALQEFGSPGGLLNCGTGEPRTWVDLVTAAFSAMGKDANIQFIPMPEELRGKYQYFTQSKVDKLRAAGYTKPFTTLEEGVKDYVQSYLLTREE
ncbi:MAG: ADP-glyceromanno-heptose 6-epimerase [Acidobacteriaceae bacterium]|nr:ADP-glyceromanno-heptose 6-epimerase [Acidobacteriaceae bacterium]